MWLVTCKGERDVAAMVRVAGGESFLPDGYRRVRGRDRSSVGG